MDKREAMKVYYCMVSNGDKIYKKRIDAMNGVQLIERLNNYKLSLVKVITVI